MRRWTFTGTLPTREAAAWVYGLNWSGTEDGTLVVHVLGDPLVLDPGDTLVRAPDGTYSIERRRIPAALLDPR